LSFGQVEGFFVDTCILLPHAVEAMREACSGFITEAGARCIISSSVKKEAIDLIENAYTVIVSNLRDSLSPYLEQKGMKELSNRDGSMLAGFFSEQRTMMKKAGLSPRSNIKNEILGAVENYVADQLHSLVDGQKMLANIFLPAIAAELTVIKHKLERPFRGIRSIDIEPDVSLKSIIAAEATIRNPLDVMHLASALEHEILINKWVVFVTTDEEEILSRDKELEEMFVKCSKPEWALDFERDMTRKKAPLECARETKSPSQRQQRIIAEIGRLTSAKATPSPS